MRANGMLVPALILFDAALSGSALKMNVNQSQKVDVQGGIEGQAQHVNARAAITQMAMMWGVGCILTALASVSDSFGLVLRKDALNKGEGEVPWFRRYKWWAGYVLSVLVSGVLESIAFSLAPLSLVAPMSGLSTVSTPIISMLYLGEKLKARGKLAIAIIVFGTSLTSTFGSHAEGGHDLKELVGFLGEGSVRMYILVILLMWVVSAIVLRAMERSGSNMSTKHSQIIFANFAGCLGGQSSIALKCTTNILASGLTSSTEMLAFVFCVVMTAVLGVTQLAVLNEGQKRFEAVTYCSQYKSLLTVYAVVGGSVAFQEYREFTAFQLIAFPGSVLVVCAGLLLMPGRKDDDVH